MSLPPPRWPGLWKRVTSASTRRKMTTHKAKLRKFEFIGSGSAPEGDEARGKKGKLPHAAKLNVGTPILLAKGMRRAYGIIRSTWLRELPNDLVSGAVPASHSGSRPGPGRRPLRQSSGAAAPRPE